MKTRLLALFIMLSAAYTTKAQYVTIPDTSLRNWFNAHGFSQCLNGNQLDTTCNKVVSDTSLSITANNNGILNFDGVQYFDNLKVLWLDCGSNTVIPAFPRLLRKIRIDGSLANLPPLPLNLQELNCAFNNLTSLPALPPTLVNLYCRNNNISVIPQLPSTLKYFDFTFNNVSVLPDLPNGLIDLSFEGNNISTLPTLPNSLVGFHALNNPISVISSIPTSLKYFSCGGTTVSSLPAFPRSMVDVDISNNAVLNHLENLPDSIIGTFDMDYVFELKCLPKIGYINLINCQMHTLQCLPNFGHIVNSIPSLNLPLCGNNNPDGCPLYWNINGQDYIDSDTNCDPSDTDLLIQNIKHRLLKNNVQLEQTYTLSNGFYSFAIEDTGLYTVQIDTPVGIFDFMCSSSLTQLNNIFSDDSLFYENNFALTCKSGFDVGAWSITTPGVFRPTNTTKVNLSFGDVSSFYNAHCAAGTAGTATVTINGPATYIAPASGALAPSNVADNVLTWNVADFGTADALRDFNIIVRTDTFAQIGQQVCLTVSVTPTAGDNNPNNNTLTHCFTIVNSYDPNDKAAYPAGNIDTAQEWLTYTVRFQNTGNAEAQHIYVMDTLDSDVDAGSFQLLAYNHQPNVQIKENIVRFNFPNINLPDNISDEPGSHGYVQYKVKLKDGLPIGTEIKNTAVIYFDFNAPVVTNTTTNTIAEIEDTTIIGIKPIMNELSLSIYPNPANQSLTVATNEAGNTIAIFNTQGKLMMKQLMNGSAETLNIAELAGGVYYVEVSSPKGTARKKVIKL